MQIHRPVDVFQTWFGCGNGWVEQAAPCAYQTAEYQERSSTGCASTANGLVRPDWATVNTANFQVDGRKGVTGVFVDTMDGTTHLEILWSNAIADVNNASKIATMTSVGPINSRLALPRHRYNSSPHRRWHQSGGSIKACLHFLLGRSQYPRNDGAGRLPA